MNASRPLGPEPDSLMLVPKGLQRSRKIVRSILLITGTVNSSTRRKGGCSSVLPMPRSGVRYIAQVEMI
jgi:hypothetical protein